MTDGRWLLAVVTIASSVSWAAPASAQVRWDAGLLAGTTWRTTTGDRSPHPTPGPSAEIHAHLAIVPMLRVGPYASFDLSPAPGTAARQVYGVGLRAKVTPPLLAAPWRSWLFIGVGFADAYTPRDGGNGAADSMGMLELPVGVGIGYRMRGPWELCAELGARVILAKGSIHTSATAASGPSSQFVRDDFLAAALSIGVSFGP